MAKHVSCCVRFKYILCGRIDDRVGEKWGRNVAMCKQTLIAHGTSPTTACLYAPNNPTPFRCVHAALMMVVCMLKSGSIVLKHTWRCVWSALGNLFAGHIDDKRALFTHTYYISSECTTHIVARHNDILLGDFEKFILWANLHSN